MESGEQDNNLGSAASLDDAEGDDHSQTSWLSYNLDGSNYQFAESYHFFKNLFYPNAYGNSANYFNSQTYRTNVLELRLDQRARCALIKGEDDWTSTIGDHDGDATGSDMASSGDSSEDDSVDLDSVVSSESSGEPDVCEGEIQEERAETSEKDHDAAEQKSEKHVERVSKDLKPKSGGMSVHRYENEKLKKERDEKMAQQCLFLSRRLKFAAKQVVTTSYRAVYTSDGESVYEGSTYGDDENIRPEDFVRCVARSISEGDISSEEDEAGMSDEYSEEDTTSEDDHRPPSIIREKWWIRQSQPESDTKDTQKEKQTVAIETEDKPEVVERDPLKEAKKEELYRWREERHVMQRTYQKQIRANADAMKRMMTMTPEELKALVRAMNLFGEEKDEEDKEDKEESVEKPKSDEKVDAEETKSVGEADEMDEMEMDLEDEEENEDENEVENEDVDQKEVKFEEVVKVEEEEVKPPEEEAEDSESEVLSVHTSEIDAGDFGGKADRKKTHAAAAAADTDILTSKDDYDWTMLLKRGMYVFPRIYHRGWSLATHTFGAEVTQMAKVVQLDHRFRVDHLNDETDHEIPLYPEQLHKRFIPYEQDSIFYDPTTSQALFMDSWSETYQRICEQALNERWMELTPSQCPIPTIEQCTALEILELKALLTEACLSSLSLI